MVSFGLVDEKRAAKLNHALDMLTEMPD